jgi:hypothetical protein
VTEKTIAVMALIEFVRIYAQIATVIIWTDFVARTTIALQSKESATETQTVPRVVWKTKTQLFVTQSPAL